MNFNKFINSDYLKSNPLCGIDTYKDELNLATGACVRQIKRLVFDGTEDWTKATTSLVETARFYIADLPPGVSNISIISTHFQVLSGNEDTPHIRLGTNAQSIFSVLYMFVPVSTATTAIALKAWLAAQYAAGTPVMAWYSLATPTTETITVPSGLSGIVEGSLTQTGTPTPTNPIYPTANTVEQWFDLNHYVMGTSTDTITTPAVLYPNDTTATVGLKGNMQQTGTPSSTTPIQPQECGERTGNLCPITSFDKTTDTYYSILFNTPIPAGTYTLSAKITSTSAESRISFRKADMTQIIASNIVIQTGRSQLTVTLDESCYGMYIYGGTTVFDNIPIKYENIMLNTGSTALPYEPYGIKIPISSANTTTPVYLGEVESTRQIKQLVLTGKENWKYSTSSQAHWIENVPNDYDNTLKSRITTVCTHYNCIQNNTGFSGMVNGDLRLYAKEASPIAHELYIKDETYTSAADFKAYLAAQYAAGTPVCVWYVLAESTTGIVNEPLRKIGDYADTLSNVSIPVTAGGDTLSVDTTLQPSEVSVNYKGWHPVQSVHEK